MKTFKAEYISDKKSIFLKKGNIYDVYIPEDSPSESFYAVYLKDMDEPGYYAVPSSRFKKIEE